ncbi:MAG TPA: PDZ domain-containing protein [Polyangiaceae bacterium]|nr:PDZ domain-containing protein [Polyangiaceae bacterium]
MRATGADRALVALVLGFVVACGGSSHGTIGAVLGRRGDGRVFLRDVPEHLAAGRAGLKPGDEVLLVDGRDVRSLDERELRAALEGAVGEEVKLTLVRDGEVLRVTLKRSMAEAYRVR